MGHVLAGCAKSCKRLAVVSVVPILPVAISKQVVGATNDDIRRVSTVSGGACSHNIVQVPAARDAVSEEAEGVASEKAVEAGFDHSVELVWVNPTVWAWLGSSRCRLSRGGKPLAPFLCLVVMNHPITPYEYT